MPLPSLVRVRAPASTLLNVMLPAPPIVRAVLPLAIVPEMVSVPPLSELIRLAEASVMGPLQVLLPRTFSSAPLLEMPVPLMVMYLFTTVPPLANWSCRSLPLSTVTVPFVEPLAPKAPGSWMFNTLVAVISVPPL